LKGTIGWCLVLRYAAFRGLDAALPFLRYLRTGRVLRYLRRTVPYGARIACSRCSNSWRSWRLALAASKRRSWSAVSGAKRRHRHRLAVVVGGDHREEAAVGVPHGALLDVLGDDLDADLIDVLPV